MIHLVNLRNNKPVRPYDVRVDRISVLGNPFKGDRDEDCNQYAEYFEVQIKKNSAFLNELRRLWKLHKQYGQLRLFCWCVPLRCHSETIQQFLNNYI
jgi:hypothetical protein